MSQYFETLVLFLLTLNCVSAQSKFGFELKFSRVKTENSGNIIGGDSFYFVPKEGDPITSSFSLGLAYRLNERNILKLHFGRHHNGRILDLDYYDDGIGGPDESYTAVSMPYNFFQVAPSYTYRILNKKWILPVEIGININQRVQEANIFFVGINEINYDYEISTGLDYRFFKHILLGLHGIYTSNLNEYQDKETVWGTYKPKQFGIEFSMMYEIGKK